MNAVAKPLLEAARKASENAYCTYSNFPVGAAIQTEDGTVFIGCNVENASFGLTICAERVALTQAVAQGHRSFTALAIVGGKNQAVSPCGACLQVLSEFCNPDMPIYSAPHQRGLPLELKMSDCLPLTFGASDLNRHDHPGSPAATAGE